MTWMLTATGSVVDLAFIEGHTINILDIAQHLSQINRYCGACSRAYSVAEHSLFVCDIMAEAGVRDPGALMAGLMHDAAEAYVQDLSPMMKRLIGDKWFEIEQRTEYAVLARFELLHQAEAWARQIKHADLTALSTERVQLLPEAGPEWPTLKTHPPVTWKRFEDSAGFTWRDWRQAFLDRFAELQFARKTRSQLGLGALQ